MTTEEMRKELEEAGYRFNFKPFDEGIVNGSGFWTPPPIITHFEPPPLAVSRREMESYIIEKAYAHLQEKKRLAALENLAQWAILLHPFNPLFDTRYNKPEEHKLAGWYELREEAIRILGGGNE